MKTFLCIFAAAGLLAGCTKTADPKITQLENRFAILESNVADLSISRTNLWRDQTNIVGILARVTTQVQTNSEQLFYQNLQLEVDDIQLRFLFPAVTNLQAAFDKKSGYPVQSFQRAASPSVMPAAVAAQIRYAAQQKWPNEYDMQVYEIKKQSDAWHQLNP